MYDTYLGRDEYDMRELVPDPFPYRYLYFIRPEETAC